MMFHQHVAIVLAARVAAGQVNGGQEMIAVSIQQNRPDDAMAGRLIGPDQGTRFRGSFAQHVMTLRPKVKVRNKDSDDTGKRDRDATKAGATHVGIQDLRSFGFLCWVVFVVAAVVYEYWPRHNAETSAPRDMRWDLVKFWCMFAVMWSHTMGFWHQDLKNEMDAWFCFPQGLVSHFHLPGFSFVSGIFAAGLVRKEGGRIAITFDKLKSSVRDLVLVQLTMKPVDMLFPLTYGSLPTLQPLSETPFVMFGEMWYLKALFVWHLLTPMLCVLRFPVLPVLMAGAVSILCRENVSKLDPRLDPSSGMWSYFVFYVLGFVLGGGGKSSEERSADRKQLERFLVDARMRAAACLFLITWAGFANQKMFEPLMLIFSANEDFSRWPTAWSLGGWFTDAARISFHVLLLGSFLVMVFMLPSCKLLSEAGSRTLYVYVLHSKFLLWNPGLGVLKTASLSVAAQHRPLVTGIISFIFTLLLGSKLMKALLHHFVQPQWLVDLCTYLIGNRTKNSTDVPLQDGSNSAAKTCDNNLS